MSRCLRLDKGTEAGKMATIHCYLRNGHDDVENPESTVLLYFRDPQLVTRLICFSIFVKLELAISYESDLPIHAHLYIVFMFN